MSPASDITVERVTEASDSLRALIASLDAELAAVYSPEQRHGISLGVLFEPHVRFFLAQRRKPPCGPACSWRKHLGKGGRFFFF
jgi:hypothetical protein